MPTSKPAATIRRARVLRRALTPPEVALWQQLRGSPAGIRFRRQHPLGPYILDFYCPNARIAIEIDGIAHGMGDNPARDTARDATLAANGIRTLRIPARDVLADAAAVADSIIRLAAAGPSTA